MVLLVLYDDEIYKSCKQLRLASGVGNWLSAQFKIKDLGETNYILSLLERMLRFSQESYIYTLLGTFKHQKFHEKVYTFQDGVVLSLVKCRLTLSEIKNYETSFGDRCLMYAIMCTKFDISCAYAQQVYHINHGKGF